MLAFVVVLISLLWIFQTVLLDSFYQGIKTMKLKSSAQAISQNIDNAELDALVQRLAQENEMCIRIVNAQMQELCTAEVTTNCIIHLLDPLSTMDFFRRADEAGGWCNETYIRDDFRNIAYTEDAFVGRVPANDEGMSKSMVYAQVVTRQDGQKLMILLNSPISPVQATVQTLRVQLACITVLMLLLSLLLAMIIARSISRPIEKLNEDAKRLAAGDYEAEFVGEGCRELEELGLTLGKAASELRKVEGLRQDLIANVSHDLRTPLTMISGYGEVMRDIPGENTPENLQIIIDESRRLSALVNDMLDISKMQSGMASLNESRFCLTEAVREILGRYTKLREQEGYEITFEAERDVNIFADELKISQVIYNLINNAINYSGARKSIRVRQTVRDGWVRLEIIDSGDGIPSEQLPLIWDRYYRVDKNHKRETVGTGLGLSIVKMVLQLHGAHYGVESAVGVGSNFWFELPEAQ